jgi:5-methylthioadenosine/S-adenosylhomocysteine deaminase
MSAASTGLDLLVRGGTALTSDPSLPVIADAVIGVRGDRLALVASAAAAPPGLTARRTVDCGGRVVTAGFVNVHTHAILTMARGMAEDMGFAPAYTPGVPRGSDVRPAEARALARLGALEALLFGSTLVNDTYVHAEETVEPMAEIGGRVFTCGRIHDVDFTRVADGHWEHDPKIGEASLAAALELAERWHGKADGRIGVQLSPHAPDTCSDALLGRVAQTSRALGCASTRTSPRAAWRWSACARAAAAIPPSSSSAAGSSTSGSSPRIASSSTTSRSAASAAPASRWPTSPRATRRVE